ncbi:MAG: LpxI family protein [Pseudomonadota bacterium]
MQLTSPVGIIAGSGTLPFAVADSLAERGIGAVLFALNGFCDPERVRSYRHHWSAIGKAGAIIGGLRAEGCRDVVFIGGLVRPAFSEIRLDLKTLTIIPKLVAAFRGGDNHLLTGVARIFEDNGFRMRGVAEVAPDLLMPAGAITRVVPDATEVQDIAKGRAVLDAMSAFDAGQGVVVIDGHVVALEDIEGTDALLARVARLRTDGRLRARAGRGVLVKAPKITQDLRFDLPALGARTVEGAAAAGLAGIAVVAGRTVLAEPQAIVEAGDRAGLFVVGTPP